MSGLWKCPVTKYVEYDETDVMTIDELNQKWKQRAASDMQLREWAENWLYGDRSMSVPMTFCGFLYPLTYEEFLTDFARGVLNESVV